MKSAESFHVEAQLVEAMQASDMVTINDALQNHPGIDFTSTSRVDTRPGEYWGLATAIVSAELGLPVGLSKYRNPEDYGMQVSGGRDALNHWLLLTGYELRMNGHAAASESRSGFYTLINNPKLGQLFEHMYAAKTGTDIMDIIVKDPMFEHVRHEQPATEDEIVDHDGFMRMYDENPDHAIRLYLTRQLPHMKHLRSTIKHAERFLSDNLEITDDMDEPTKAMMEGILKERQELAPFERARLEYWQTQYDFTSSLLMEGYEPYSLKDLLPHVRDYLIGLLATKPELSPTRTTAEIPDVKAGIGKLLLELQKKVEQE